MTRQAGVAVLERSYDIVLGTAPEIAVPPRRRRGSVGRRRRRRRREWTSPTTFARWPTRERASAEPALYCATSAATGMIKYRVYAQSLIRDLNSDRLAPISRIMLAVLAV